MIEENTSKESAATLGEDSQSEELSNPVELADEPEVQVIQSDQLKKVLEGALLAVGEALTVDKLLTLFDESEKPEKKEVLQALESIQEDHKKRGYNLVEVASGWRFQVCSDLAPWVNRLWEEKPQKYSRALLETLSLIAYRQPLTRGDIEEVRGVAVSSHIIKTLAEREWIKVVGHRDVPGRPSLYATTRQFLDYFGLKSLDELPSLGELKDIDSLNADLNLSGSAEADEKEQIEEAKEEGVEVDENLADSIQDAIEADVTIEQAQVAVAHDEATEELTSNEDEYSVDVVEHNGEAQEGITEADATHEDKNHQLELDHESHDLISESTTEDDNETEPKNEL